VSKGLVLYHFANRDRLLCELLDWLTARIVLREQRALDGAAGVLDALWQFLLGEIECGELYVALVLTAAPIAGLARAAQSSNDARQAQARRTVQRVYDVLELVPTLPVPHLATTEQAFREGLVLAVARGHAGNARAAFDVFWLSLLSQSM
jgi:AcrR family transcriptional regulator